MRLLSQALIACLYLNPCFSFAQSWSEDIELYAQTVSQKHKNPFFEMSEGLFWAEIANLKNNTSQLTDLEMKISLLQLNAQLKDPHTDLYFPYDQILPLEFYWLEEGLFVQNVLPGQEELLFARLVHIEGIEVEEIVDRLSSVIPHDNIQILKQNLCWDKLCRPDYLYGLGIIQSEEEATYGLELPNGEMTTVRIFAIQRESLRWATRRWPLYLQNQHLNYWYQYLEEEDLMYVQYRRCANHQEEDFKTFNQRLFEEVDQIQPNKLVLDIRNNPGGNSRILAPFIRQILKRKDLNQTDHFYVVIGRKTFSSAVLNAIRLDMQSEGRLVGESSGGIFPHYGEVKGVDLPFSGGRLQYSTDFFELTNYPSGPVEPDIVIPHHILDAMQYQDPVLNWIFRQ